MKLHFGEGVGIVNKYLRLSALPRASCSECSDEKESTSRKNSLCALQLFCHLIYINRLRSRCWMKAPIGLSAIFISSQTMGGDASEGSLSERGNSPGIGLPCHLWFWFWIMQTHQKIFRRVEKEFNLGLRAKNVEGGGIFCANSTICIACGFAKFYK